MYDCIIHGAEELYTYLLVEEFRSDSDSLTGWESVFCR